MTNLLNLSRDGTVATQDHSELVSRYRRLREVSKHLNNDLLKSIPKQTIDEAAKKLGLLQQGILIVDSESEMAVLMDYLLYEMRQDGRTLIERYFADVPPPPGSDQMLCVQAMQHAVYSLFVIDSVVPNVGMMLRDLQTQQIRLVVDLGLARTASPGFALATRVLPFDDFAMLAGASLPVGDVRRKDEERMVKTLLSRAADGSVDTAKLIRTLLMSGRSANIAYQDPSLTGGPHRRIGSEPAAKSARNSPCPCGSGKKYKHCCLSKE